MVLDGGTIQIYKGCQYHLTLLNSTDKFDWILDKKSVDNGFELHCKGLFSVKNGEVSKHLETFSNFSIKTPEQPLFKEKIHHKI